MPRFGNCQVSSPMGLRGDWALAPICERREGSRGDALRQAQERPCVVSRLLLRNATEDLIEPTLDLDRTKVLPQIPIADADLQV
jgi:hypothetical protein